MPSLSIVLPAHNEEATIEDVLNQVSDTAQQLGIDYEIILVNDGSTDRTGEIARELSQHIPNLRLLELKPHPTPHYGKVLRTGFEAATKELIAFFPTDKQFVFNEINQLLERLDNEKADIVSGYRVDRQDNIIRRFNAAGWNMIVRLLFGYLCRDIDCGFKLFRREILDHVPLFSDGAMIDTEFLAGARARGYRITDVAVTHLPRRAGEATGADLSVIVKAFRDLARFRWQLSQELHKERQKD